MSSLITLVTDEESVFDSMLEASPTSLSVDLGLAITANEKK
jgi:hypothetical protein